MSIIKEFETAAAVVAAEAAGDEVVFDFQIKEFGPDPDDPDNEVLVKTVVCHAFQPSEGQFMMLMADTQARSRSMGERLAAIIDFVIEVMDDESQAYITGRLMDRHDAFGLADIEPIAEWLIEEWGGRPTKQPSDFAPSRKTGGQRSTPRTRKSTSSASARTAS